MDDNVCSLLNLRHIHYHHDVPALNLHVHFRKPRLNTNNTAVMVGHCAYSCRICTNSRRLQYKRGAHLIITPWHSNGFSGRGRIFTGQNSPQVHNALQPGAAGCRPRLKPIPCTLISGDRVWSHSMNEPIMQRSRIPVLQLLSFTTFCIIAFTCTSLCEAVAD